MAVSRESWLLDKAPRSVVLVVVAGLSLGAASAQQGADQAAPDISLSGAGGFAPSAWAFACDPDGTYHPEPSPTYSCAEFPPLPPVLEIDITAFHFSSDGSVITTGASLSCALSGEQTGCPSGNFDASCVSPGTCTETYQLVGGFTGPDTWSGTFTAQFSGDCFDCSYQSWVVTGTRVGIFSDGFESGDTSMWSATVPPYVPPGETCDSAANVSAEAFPFQLFGTFGDDPATGGSCDTNANNTVWFSYTPAVTGDFLISLTNNTTTDAYSRLAVFSTTECSPYGTELTCATAVGKTVSDTVALTAGTPHLIMFYTDDESYTMIDPVIDLSAVP